MMWLTMLCCHKRSLECASHKQESVQLRARTIANVVAMPCEH